jgi:hypothetical protein
MSEARDARLGCRRSFCADGRVLAEDLAEQEGTVSVTGVTEPFAAVTDRQLSEAFPYYL